MDGGVAAASVVSINLFLVWPVLKHLPGTPFVRMEDAAEFMFGLLMDGMRNPIKTAVERGVEREGDKA